MLLAGVVTTAAAVIKGVVTDRSSGDPLMQATVRLLRNRADSAFVDVTTCNLDGRFTLPGVKNGKYLLSVTYVGYNPLTLPVNITGGANVDLDTLRLQESSILLREATIVGVATPITAKEDTLEYNASSYTTPPNAVVEDLLKRLPGVEVDSEGKITAQGQTVKKILIDGEEFFSDDPKVASKNIPVAMVKNAQVINRKSDLARMTGVDDGEDEMVINLTVKPDMKNGVTGQAEGGYGSNSTYKGSFIVNQFKSSNTFTFLGNINNINDAGFTDSNSGRFMRFGGDNGINTTRSLGFNFNVGNKQFRAGGNILYSNNDRENASETHRTNLFANGRNTTTTSSSNSTDKGNNLRGDFRLKWDPDSFNTLEFRPNFSLNFNRSNSASSSANYDNALLAMAQSRNLSQSDGRSLELGGRLIYNHNFEQHRGRSFSLSTDYRLSNVREDITSWSRNAFWNLDSIYENYQITNNHRWTNSVYSRLTWTEPIGPASRGNFLEVSYGLNLRWNNADKTVNHDFLRLDSLPDYTLGWRAANWNQWGFDDRLQGLGDLAYDPINSNSFRNSFVENQFRIGYRKVSAKANLNVGVSVNPSTSSSTNLSNPAKTIAPRHVLNYAPFLRFRYKWNAQTSLNAFYNGRSSQPSLDQLQPVEDSSDPMNIIQGNPNLNPTFTHRLHAHFQNFNQEKQQSIMAMMMLSFAQNAVATNVTTNRATGGRYTTYENVNGNWNLHAFTLYSRPFGSSKTWTINNALGGNFAQTTGFIAGEKNTAGRLNLNESVGIAYRPANLELELRPFYNFAHNTNTLSTQAASNIHSFGGRFNSTYYTPFGVVLSSDLNYAANRGYTAGYDLNTWTWNASISYMFLRDKSATIAIKANDILNQRTSIMRTETAQAITDTKSLVLGRYVMATLTWKFSSFGGGKAPTVDTEFMRQGPPRGPGGPGPGPRPM